MRKTLKGTFMILGGTGLLAAALALRAAPPISVWTPSPGRLWKAEHTVDFATTTVTGHDTYSLISPASGTTKVKAEVIYLGRAMGAAATCLELETAADGDANADTRLWVRTPAGYHGLNDNNGASRFSKARVFVRGYVIENTQLLAAARTSAFNAVPFRLIIRRLNQTESQCTSGQGLPWVKILGQGPYDPEKYAYSANAL